MYWLCVHACVFYRAFVYLSQNNYAEAHAFFIEVLKIDPKNPVVSSKHVFYFQQLYTAGGDLKDLMWFKFYIRWYRMQALGYSSYNITFDNIKSK